MDLSDVQATARAVKLVQDRHHRELDRRLRAAGTTLAQWDALRAVARHPGASTHELAVLTFMTDQSFGALAMKLADQHLITRTPGHGRVIHHDITALGETVLATADPLVDEVLTESFAPLSPAERDVLRGLLERTAAGWEERAAGHGAERMHSGGGSGRPKPGRSGTVSTPSTKR